MSDTNTATAAAPEQKTDAQPAAHAAATASDQKPAAAQPSGDGKPAAAEPAKAAEHAKGDAKPEGDKKPTSLIGDAGKAQPNADGAKKEGDAGDGKKEEANNDGKKEGDAKPAVPEKYDIKVPEGMTLDQAALEKFTPIAKELGLNNEQVQKLADFQASFLTEQVKAAETRQADAFKSFCEATLKDTTEFFGSKLESVLPLVAKGRDNFANPGVIAKLEASGLSNDKDFILMFEKMGRTVSEDKLVDGRRDTGKDQRTPGSIIYGNDKK